MPPHATLEQTGYARAKVNLFLHVVGRRADGYHLLDSLAVFPAIGDAVRAEPQDHLSLSITGPFGAALTAGPDNLVLRAARLLADRFGVMAGARLVLEKNLPVASGIGGGSADAAAAMRVLCRLWSVSASTDDLALLAQRLGADVPVCVAQRPARMQGIGETLGAAPDMPDCGMVLINPGVAVSTPDVFRARSGGFSPPATLPAGWADAAGMAHDLGATGNDLEAAALALCPQIGSVLSTLRAAPLCLLARMSGSGATCFAIFPDVAAANAATIGLSRNGWWVWGGSMTSMGLPDQVRAP